MTGPPSKFQFDFPKTCKTYTVVRHNRNPFYLQVDPVYTTTVRFDPSSVDVRRVVWDSPLGRRRRVSCPKHRWDLTP